MKEVEFLEFILKNIVNNPDDIIINASDDELGTLLAVQVNPADMGIIIGKKGSTISSLRSLMRLQGMKIGKKVTLKIIEESHN